MPTVEMPSPIARVEPLTRTRALRGPFDYRLRPDQAVQVGSLLQIPFAGRTTLGVVVELAAASELEPERLSEPQAVLTGGPPSDLVELAGWMAREYCSTPARALALMLAPGSSRGTRRREVLWAEPVDGKTNAPGVGEKTEAVAVQALAGQRHSAQRR